MTAEVRPFLADYFNTFFVIQQALSSREWVLTVILEFGGFQLFRPHLFKFKKSQGSTFKIAIIVFFISAEDVKPYIITPAH